MFAGTLFVGTLASLLYPDVLLIKNQPTINALGIIVLILFSFLILISMFCFYFFLTTKTIWLAKNKFIINYLFLPYKKTFDLADIQSITQKSKTADTLDPRTFSKIYVFTNRLTTIKLSNGKALKINSIVQSDFEILMSNIRKLKDGQITLKNKRGRFSDYIFANLDGLPVLFFILIMTIGLVYHIINKN
ncbi:MAG: hypothetical protein ACXVPW_08540 [Bacteroidia bacterium]